ncbi:hypothetical protein [Acetilactobacillus jinshanensis]|uniref:Uncharacterized protein n=1 Tax=Acetilactobacillus jinshanensis TaxID=1720083 RepID=A0A4P6ZLM0_9LACO|nr:hypothetical protein [Acetilactobacillus jinshanensis]QBP18483.1 hypothetical protein ELX58_04895 [Acetilactobacillus jinshanensis]
MLYNKKQFRKANDKKVLHKIGKHWVTVSVAMLAMLGVGAAINTGSVSHVETATAEAQPSIEKQAKALLGNLEIHAAHADATNSQSNSANQQAKAPASATDKELQSVSNSALNNVSSASSSAPKSVSSSAYAKSSNDSTSNTKSNNVSDGGKPATNSDNTPDNLTNKDEAWKKQGVVSNKPNAAMQKYLNSPAGKAGAEVLSSEVNQVKKHAGENGSQSNATMNTFNVPNNNKAWNYVMNRQNLSAQVSDSIYLTYKGKVVPAYYNNNALYDSKGSSDDPDKGANKFISLLTAIENVEVSDINELLPSGDTVTSDAINKEQSNNTNLQSALGDLSDGNTYPYNYGQLNITIPLATYNNAPKPPKTKVPSDKDFINYVDQSGNVIMPLYKQSDGGPINKSDAALKMAFNNGELATLLDDMNTFNSSDPKPAFSSEIKTLQDAGVFPKNYTTTASDLNNAISKLHIKSISNSGYIDLNPISFGSIKVNIPVFKTYTGTVTFKDVTNDDKVLTGSTSDTQTFSDLPSDTSNGTNVNVTLPKGYVLSNNPKKNQTTVNFTSNTKIKPLR